MRRTVSFRRWQIGGTFLLLTAVYVATLVWIQHGRLQSCRTSYQGVREIFQPFLNPPPKPGDGKRYHDYVKFNNRVDFLRGNCSKQIRLWWP